MRTRHIPPLLAEFLRVNTYFGISDLAFSVGDEVVSDFVTYIHFLPAVQMVSPHMVFSFVPSSMPCPVYGLPVVPDRYNLATTVVLLYRRVDDGAVFVPIA